MTAIIARFKSSGVPQTGLSPTVTINQVADNGEFTEVVSSAAMTERGDGFYAYAFSTFNILKNYVFSFDAGAESDVRYPEAEWSGIQSFVDQMPRGGGGSTVVQGLSKEQIEELAKGLEESIKGLFDSIEITVDAPEDKSKDTLEAFLKEQKEYTKKHQEKLVAIIEKKAQEIKSQEIKTEVVDTKALEARLSSVLTQSVKETGNNNKEQIDAILGDFAVWLSKDLKAEVKKMLERERAVIKAEVEQEMITEFKKRL